MKVEDTLIVSCKGIDYSCVIKSITDDLVEVEILFYNKCKSEPSIDLTLYQAVPKLDKLEIIIQKSVELEIEQGLHSIDKTNREYYLSECDKLDSWGEEMKEKIQLELETLEREIKETAVSIYEIMGCRGLARVDFFLEAGPSGGYGDGRPVFNEINTIPGFTAISMYPQLWEASGIGYSELIDKLIELAEEK